MFRLISLFFAAAVAAMLFLPHGAPPSGVYAMAPAQALAILDRVDLPPAIFGDVKSEMRHWRPDKATSMWARVGDGSVELQRFKASLTPEGEGVRVQVEAQPPEGKLHDETAASMKDDSAYSDYQAAALAEQIDAKLTGRAFDMRRLAPAFARVQIASIPRIRAMGDAAAKINDQRVSDTIDDAYSHEHEARDPPASPERRIRVVRSVP